MDERKRKERGKPESESTREAPEEQLWERIREGRKETNRKLSTRNRKRSKGNRAEEKVENGKTERKARSIEEATVRQRQEAGKGRNRG